MDATPFGGVMEAEIGNAVRVVQCEQALVGVRLLLAIFEQLFHHGHKLFKGDRQFIFKLDLTKFIIANLALIVELDISFG